MNGRKDVAAEGAGHHGRPPAAGPFQSWGRQPLRGWLMTEDENEDATLRRAVYADAGRAYVMVCPAWFSGPMESLSTVAAELALGTVTTAEALAVVASVAADLHALAIGYAGAVDVDLHDPNLSDAAAEFLADVLGVVNPRALSPEWGAALAAAEGGRP